MSVRTHSEAIAFLGSGPLENLLTNQTLESLLKTQGRLIEWQYALQLCIHCFNYIGSILSYLIVGFAIFSLKEYDHLDSVALSGVISRNSFFYMYLINSFSKLIELSQKFSSMAGNVHRVGEILMHMQNKETPTVPPGQSPSSGAASPDRPHHRLLNHTADIDRVDIGIVDKHSTTYRSTSQESVNVALNTPKPLIELKNVTFFTAGSSKKGSVIARNLSLVINKNARILVTGDSSAGKSSLLRVIAGLWPHDSGSLTCNLVQTSHRVMFVPQKPYLPLGTLRQQVVYPTYAEFVRDSYTSAVIAEILAMIDMGDLVSRVGGLDAQVCWNWHDILSPGEMQRLCFARILYHRPTIAFLDEATASVGLDMERRLYQLLVDHGVHYVSVGHRMSLKQFHDHELHLDAKQVTWTYTELSRASSYLTMDSTSSSLERF